MPSATFSPAFSGGLIEAARREHVADAGRPPRCFPPRSAGASLKRWRKARHVPMGSTRWFSPAFSGGLIEAVVEATTCITHHAGVFPRVQRGPH